jgi:hypothetical protein
LAARLTGLPHQWMPALIHLLARGGLTLICPLIGEG